MEKTPCNYQQVVYEKAINNLKIVANDRKDKYSQSRHDIG